ncbi:hypothetical protein KAR10_00565 [bacterium]|nr:hypothetical protein [bacterium]
MIGRKPLLLSRFIAGLKADEFAVNILKLNKWQSFCKWELQVLAGVGEGVAYAVQ